MKNALLFLAALAASVAAQASPVVYHIDPEHTFPSFEADHMGMSMWRGKFNRTSGRVVMDRAAGTGTVEVSIEIASIDFGHAKLNEYMTGPEQLDAKKFPTARYTGKLERFVGGAPTAVSGELTLHGVTRPVALRVDMFKCIPHPLFKREWCGADLFGSLKRDAFGLDYAPQWGFKPDVILRIQVEAVAEKK